MLHQERRQLIQRGRIVCIRQIQCGRAPWEAWAYREAQERLVVAVASWVDMELRPGTRRLKRRLER